MKRKLVIAILGFLAALAVTLVVALVTVHTDSFRGWLGEKLEATLTEATGRPATLLISDLSPLQLCATVEGFTIAGASPEAPPLVSISRVDLDANWSAVFRQRADLASLTVDGLRLDLEQLPLDLPEEEPQAPPFSIADFVDLFLVDRLEVTDSWLHFADADLPLDILAEDVALSADFHRLDHQYQGTISAGAGGMSIPEAGDFPVQLQTDFSLGPKTITFSAFQLNSTGLSLSGGGELTDWGLPAYSASFDVDVTPGALPLPALADLELGGSASVNGDLEGQGDDVRMTASVRSEQLDVASVAARDISCRLALEEGRLRVTDISLGILGTRVDGELSAAASGFVPYSAELQLASDDPDPLMQWLFPESRPGGTGSFTGSLDLSGTEFDLRSLTGELVIQARDLVLADALEFPMAIEAEADFVGGVADIRRFAVSAPDTRVTGSGVLALDSPSSIAFNADLGSMEPLSAGISAADGLIDGSVDLPETISRLRGRLRVDGEISVPRLDGFDISTLAGGLNIVAGGISLAETPGILLDADLETRIAGGEIFFHRGHVEAAGLVLDAAGGLGMTGASGLTLRAEAQQVEESLAAARQLLVAFDQPAELLDPLASLSGSLVLDARVDGRWAELDGEADMAVDGLVSGGQPMGRLSARALSRGGVVELSGLLDGAEGAIQLTGEADLGGTDGIPARFLVRLDGQPLEPLVAAAGLDLPLSGLVDGDTAITFPGTEVRATLALREGVAAGIPLEAPVIELLYAGDRLEVTRVQVEAAGGVLSVSGTLGDGAETDDLSFQGSGFQLSRVVEQFELPVDLDGRLDLSGTVTGVLDQPRLTAAVKLAEMSADDWSAPELEGELLLDPNGVDLRLASADGRASVVLDLGFDETAVWAGEIRYPVHLASVQGQEDDPAADGFTIHGNLLASFRMHGPDPATLEGNGRIEELRIDAAGRHLAATGPLVARFASGAAVIEPFRLEGPGTGLELAGTLALDDSRETSLTVAGTADLHLLQGFIDQLRSEGLAEIDLSVRGSAGSLDTEGEIRLSKGRLRHPDLPVALEEIETVVELRPGHWQVNRLEMDVGGGEVTGSGEVVTDGLEAESYRFELKGRGVRMAYPEGFRSELDADLTLARGVDGVDLLAGEVRIIGGLYDEDFQIEQQLMTRTRAVDVMAGGEPDLLDQVNLNLRVTAADGLWVRNNLASMETSTGLQVRGTIGRPDVSGRVTTLEGGTVTFRGVNYQIVRGSIDFPGGAAAETKLDIRAETSRSEYDILLAISGSLENLKFDLSSSPPLSQTDIVTLLVTGRTRDDLGSGGGGLSQDEATVYLSGRLSGSLAPTLKRSLGLDEVTVDPVLMGGQSDLSARITVGKSLSSRLFVTYSSLVGSDRQDIYQVKYRLTDRLNLLGTRDEDGSMAGDAIFKARYYRGPSRGGLGEGDDAAERKIASIDFIGNRIATDRRLRRLIGVSTRDLFHRSRLMNGLENIRDWYYIEGFPEVDVQYAVEEEDDTVALKITIEEGRRLVLRLEEAPRPHRKLRRSIYELWSRSVFHEELLEEGARLIVDTLRGRGYVQATVDASTKELKPGKEEMAYLVDKGPRVKVNEIRILGAQLMKEDRIRDRMLTVVKGLLEPGEFSPELMDEDAEAIRGLYASAGFLDAVISHTVEFPSPRRAVITVEIEEGRQYRLDSVTFKGNQVFTGENLLAEAGLLVDSPYNDADVREVERKLVLYYDRQGYNEAGVRSDIHVDRERAMVDVVFQVDEGLKLVVESVEIVAGGITNPEVIRRELELWAGQPLSSRKADKSQYNLYRTGLFRSVGYKILPGKTPESRRVVFTLDETKNLIFDYGFGVDSDEGLRLSGNAAHMNVFGKGLYVGLGGRWSRVESRAQLAVRQPRLWGSRVEGLGTLYLEDEDRSSYVARRLGLNIQGTRRYHDGLYSLIWGYGLQDLDIIENKVVSPPPGSDGGGGSPPIDPREETETRLGNLRFNAARDTRDTFLWPTDGSYTRTDLSVYDSVLFSEADYLKGFIQWNRYQKVLGPAIWVSGVRLGLAQPYGDSEFLPISERYFTGGDSSIRGHKYDSLPAVGAPYTPDNESDASTGGNALFLFNQELMVPVYDPFFVVLFYDAGNLYWEVSDFDITDLRHSAGLGLRIKTPVGPLRLEYGWKLDQEEGESPGRFHFSFGMPF